MIIFFIVLSQRASAAAAVHTSPRGYNGRGEGEGEAWLSKGEDRAYLPFVSYPVYE